MCEVVTVECCVVSQDGEPPAKRPSATIRVGSGFKWNLQALTTAADAVESGGKSPVSALNELGVRVSYSLLRQGGPAHCPIFTVALNVADMTFEGWGHSKREARAAAARSCLAALLARAGRVLPSQQNQVMDFTSDLTDKITVSEFQCLEATSNTSFKSTDDNPNPDSPSMTPSTALFGGLPVAQSFSKSPINLLYENYPGLTFVCTFGDGSPLNGPQGNIAPLQLSHSMRFKVVCHIKEQIFEGYGSSKKLAKLAAARAALAQLAEGRTDYAPVSDGALPQTLADHVSKLVNEKFNELMKDDLNHSKRKVLAGIVLTIDKKTEGAKVITVTTGTKCVSGEHMSVRGRAVNDCHAEVAARRCLQRYLYAQLLKYAAQSNPQAVIPEADIEPAAGGGYQMKANRHLHLYVSTAPCGDGRIFSPHEPNEPAPDKHPNRQARGQLRTKIESGEGTIPVKNCTNVLQTWDGVMQGERLLTMSCSDKVARWCVVGLQGALLSRLIKPVYLHSLVLGSLLHPHHMYRALCGRIEGYISSLPPPFKLHKPILARAASTEARTPARAPSFSVCWSITAPIPEVLNAMTGKLESGQPSLLCKQSMFARWQYLMKRLAPVKDELSTTRPLARIDENLLYGEAKQQCPVYQEAKTRLFDAFERAKLGKWIKKPLEQDQFVCELIDADPRFLFAWAGDGLRGYNSMQHVLNDMVRELGRRKGAILDRNELDNNVGIGREVDGETGNNAAGNSVLVSGNKGVDSGSNTVKKPAGIVWKLIKTCNNKDSGAASSNKTYLQSNVDDLAKAGQNMNMNDGMNHLEVAKTKGIFRGNDAIMCQNVFSVNTDQITGFDEYDNVAKVGNENVEVKAIKRVTSRIISDKSRNMEGIDLQSHSGDVTFSSSFSQNERTLVDSQEDSKKEIDDTIAINNRKYLDLIRKSSVSYHDADDITVHVDRGCRNVSTKNDTTVDRNDAYGSTSITYETIDSTDASLIIDRDFRYRYVMETEKFWNPLERYNPTYYQKDDGGPIASININYNTKLNNIDKTKETDSQSINDLINNLKVCNLQNDKQSKETQQHYEHPNDINSQDTNSNVEHPNSVLLNKLKAIERIKAANESEIDSNISNSNNSKIFHILDEKDSKQVFKPKTGVSNVTIPTGNKDTPHTSKSSCELEKITPDPPNANIKCCESTRDSHIERFKINVINKENVANNATESDRVVNIDDGKHIRSAVLLRRLGCKKT